MRDCASIRSPHFFSPYSLPFFYSIQDPLYTYATNVMGTVNLLECVRRSSCVKSLLNVTTDKVYLNREWCWGYRDPELMTPEGRSKLKAGNVQKVLEKYRR